MSDHSSQPGKPPDTPWSHDSLVAWCSYYVVSSLAPASQLAYTSALKSYHEFCHLHQLSPEPAVDSLSFFLTYRSLQLRPQTLSSYLSGICNQLEVFYPQVRELRRAPIVRHTLAGIHRVHGTNARCFPPTFSAWSITINPPNGTMTSFSSRRSYSASTSSYASPSCVPLTTREHLTFKNP